MEVRRTETSVREALAGVTDPETRLSIMRMDLIHHLKVTDDGCVRLVFRPSSPVCPMAYALGGAIKKAVEKVDGVASCEIIVENYERAAHLQSILNTSG
jgi:metal-sulfur cluster biosynthetic enzyme